MWTYFRSKNRFRWIDNLLSSAHLSSYHRDRWIRTAGERRRKCAQKLSATAPRRPLSWGHLQELQTVAPHNAWWKWWTQLLQGLESRTHAMRCWINRSGDVTRNDVMFWAANWSELVALCRPICLSLNSGIQNQSRKQTNISLTTNECWPIAYM